MHKLTKAEHGYVGKKSSAFLRSRHTEKSEHKNAALLLLSRPPEFTREVEAALSPFWAWRITSH